MTVTYNIEKYMHVLYMYISHTNMYCTCVSYMYIIIIKLKHTLNVGVLNHSSLLG